MVYYSYGVLQHHEVSIPQLIVDTDYFTEEEEEVIRFMHEEAQAGDMRPFGDSMMVCTRVHEE